MCGLLGDAKLSYRAGCAVAGSSVPESDNFFRRHPGVLRSLRLAGNLPRPATPTMHYGICTTNALPLIYSTTKIGPEDASRRISI
jgi:hypothetical protein